MDQEAGKPQVDIDTKWVDHWGKGVFRVYEFNPGSAEGFSPTVHAGGFEEWKAKQTRSGHRDQQRRARRALEAVEAVVHLCKTEMGKQEKTTS